MSIGETILPLTETLAPADQAAVAEAVRSASQSGTPVYPIGGGTMLEYGVRPSRPGCGLSLSGLNRLLDYPAEDMTVTIEAGMTAAELARHLAGRQQRLPIDVRQPARATIGGMIATGISGPRQYAHGTIRDYVLGLSAVDGCGQPFSTGGRVVKNAAGYNLGRLMVGSLGTLGVVTQVTLMVRPQPEASAMVACDVSDFDMTEQLLSGVVQSQTCPAAIELLAGRLGQEGPLLGPFRPGTAARLIVGFEGCQADVNWMLDEMIHQWQAASVPSVMTVLGEQAKLLWNWLAGLSAQVEIHVLPSRTVGLIQQLLAMEPELAIQSHAGNGVIRGELPFLPGEGRTMAKAEAEVRPDRFACSLAAMRAAVAAAEGTLIVLSCPADVTMTRQDIWGPPGNALPVMRAIKERFDPRGVLNPGRFIFEDP